MWSRNNERYDGLLTCPRCNKKYDGYWQECDNCIQKFYPET